MATLWPPIYMVLFMASIGFSFFFFGKPSQKPPQIDFFKYIFPLHCLTMLLCFALTAIYVVHAFKSDRFSQEMRILWVIVLFMGNMLAFPVYWWLYLRPRRVEGAPAPTHAADPAGPS